MKQWGTRAYIYIDCTPEELCGELRRHIRLDAPAHWIENDEREFVKELQRYANNRSRLVTNDLKIEEHLHDWSPGLFI